MEGRLFLIWFPVFMGLASGLAGTEEGQQLSEACDSAIKIPCVLLFNSKKANCYMTNMTCVPDNLPHDLSSLCLAFNRIEFLQSNSFERYTNLEVLDISYNNIMYIATAAFYPLDKLRILDLSYNKNLGSFSSDIFKWSNNLVELTFTGCGLTTIPHDIFKWLRQLQRIQLGKNLISSMNITMCPDEKIENIDLAENIIEIMTIDTFVFPCKCQVMGLQYNPVFYLESEVIESLSTESLDIGSQGVDISYLEQVYVELFKGVSHSPTIVSLWILFFDVRAAGTFRDIGNKSLSMLLFFDFINFSYMNHVTFFQNLPPTRRLQVFMGRIQVIRPSFFDGMDKLLELDLTSSTIFYINSTSSCWNISLHSLNLNTNLLSSVNIDTFRGLDSLVYLDLSNNRMLRHLSLALINLKYLNISHTAVTTSSELLVPNLTIFNFADRIADPYMTFHFLETFKRSKCDMSLKEFNISESQIHLSELWKPHKNASLFKRLKQLTYLDMHGNDLLNLPRGIFSGLSLLRELYLSSCKISHIDPNVFQGLHSLFKLSVTNNNLISLPASLFFTTSGLQVLYIDLNMLTYLPDNLFANTHVLTNLTLARNEFTSLNVTTFKPIMSTIRFIDISENPFECLCDFKWMVTWLRNTSNVVQENDATCSPALENKLRGKLLSTIDPSDLCDTHLKPYWLISFIAIALIIITSVIAFQKKWVLRHKLFLLRLAILGYRQSEDARHHSDFKYDLTIMFTSDDETWASECFIKRLTEQVPDFQRIVFGDKGLPCGEFYLNAVLYAVEHSFKTILLVSKASTNDSEFMMKLRIALNHINDTNMQSTILVFRENIPDKEMPYLIKLYLCEQMPYLNWEESEEGQNRFWKQLIKKLKVNVRRNDMVPPE